MLTLTTGVLFISTGLLLILSTTFGYGLYNSLKKIEFYEDTVEEYEKLIERYYENTAITLQTMRSIDDRQLFEKDDDVGVTFQMLVDTLNELKPEIYGVRDGEKENK